MNELDKKANILIMQEIGCEVGPRQRIYDQDTGDAIKINGSDVVAPGNYAGPQSMEFDPYNNRKMMGQIFSHFLKKNSEETGVDVVAFYNVGNGDNSSIECRLSDNRVIRSNEYSRDSLKYTDIIMQLNGDGATDLKVFDVPSTRNNIRRR